MSNIIKFNPPVELASMKEIHVWQCDCGCEHFRFEYTAGLVCIVCDEVQDVE